MARMNPEYGRHAIEEQDVGPNLISECGQPVLEIAVPLLANDELRGEAGAVLASDPELHGKGKTGGEGEHGGLGPVADGQGDGQLTGQVAQPPAVAGDEEDPERSQLGQLSAFCKEAEAWRSRSRYRRLGRRRLPSRG